MCVWVVLCTQIHPKALRYEYNVLFWQQFTMWTHKRSQTNHKTQQSWPFLQENLKYLMLLPTSRSRFKPLTTEIAEVFSCKSSLLGVYERNVYVLFYFCLKFLQKILSNWKNCNTNVKSAVFIHYLTEDAKFQDSRIWEEVWKRSI